MTLLLLSLLGLGLGPLLDRFIHQRAAIVSFLEGFVAATILGLVLGHILPEAVEVGGWPCLPLAFLGLILPQIAENWRRGSELGVHGTVALLALAGLFLHTLVDGAALAGAHHHPHDTTSTALAAGVVLHRLPVGLTVWWLVRRSAGTAAAAASLLTICAGTLIGFAATEAVVEYLDTASIALFQAFVGGSLVHVVLHRSLSEALAPAATPRPEHPGPVSGSGLGALAGIGVLVFVPLAGHETGPGVADFVYRYWATSAPALLAGFCAWSLLQRLLVSSRTDPPSAARSLVLLPHSPGAPLPPARETLAPLLGPDALFLSIPVLGLPLAGLRILTAGILALIGRAAGHRPEPEPPPQERPGLSRIVDHAAPWLLIGFLCAALLETFLSETWVRALPPGADLAGLILLGGWITFPPVAAIPVAAALLRAGASPGAAIALLLIGPISTRNLRRTGENQRGRLYTALLFAAVLALGLAVNQVARSIPVPGLAHAPFPPWRHACNALLGLLLVLSLLRLGPGGMVARLGATHDHDHHTHH